MEKSASKTDDNPVKIENGLWRLGHDHFLHYLVCGTKAAALIETGVTATAPMVISACHTLNVSPRYLIVTHPHVDHVTGLPLLKEAFPESSVICGPGAGAFLGKEKIRRSIERDDQFITAFLKKKAGHTEIPDMTTALTFKEGEVIDLGGVTLIFVEIKGHAPGHLGVFVPELKALFPSDALGFFMPPADFFPTFFTGYLPFLASLNRLEAFDAEILGLPHQGVFRKEKVRLAFLQARRSAQYVYEYAQADWEDEEKTAEKLFGSFYRDELRLYSPENIMECCRLLVRRSREEKGGAKENEGHRH